MVNACGYGVGKPDCGYSGAALSIEGCARSREEAAATGGRENEEGNCRERQVSR